MLSAEGEVHDTFSFATVANEVVTGEDYHSVIVR